MFRSNISKYPDNIANCSNITGDCDAVNGAIGYTSGTLQESFNKLQYAVCPILFVVGISGNLMTVLTVTKPQFRQFTSRYVLCALAVSDSLLLCTNPFNQHFMQTLIGLDARALSRYGCKLFFVAYRTGKMSSSWFIVMVAVERFFAVWLPLRVKRILTVKNTTVAIIVVFLSMTTLSALWVFSTDIVAGICLPDAVTPENRSLHKNFVVAGAVFYSIAPISILVTITPPIIIKLIRQQRRRRTLLSSDILRSARDTSKITVMLIGIVVVYIVCVTPITLVLVLTFWTNEPIFGSHKKEFIILTSLAQSFEQLNHSTNFCIYVLCSSQFRNGFLQMIGCRRRPRDSPGAPTCQVSTSQFMNTELSSAAVSADFN